MADPGSETIHKDSARAEVTSSPESRRMWTAGLVCFVASVILGGLSDGCYHDDDLTHYLMARWAWWYPSYLLHIWGRPGLTVPLAAVSWMGDRFFAWHAARILSAVVTAVGAVVAARLAMRWGVRRGWMVVLACYAQPLNSLLSFTTLTENWTALYLICATALLDCRRVAAASLVFSLALVTRHEAVVFIPIWWIALASVGSAPRRVVLSALLSLWAPIAHNMLFHATFGEWPVRMYFQPHGSTEYLAAGPLSYLPHILYAIPPVVLAWAFIGWRWFARWDRWLIIAFPLLFLVLHTAIKALGVFASGGYGRFLVAVSPFVGMLAAAGVERFLDGKVLTRFWASLAVVIIVGWVAVEVESKSGRLWLGGSTLLLSLRLVALALVLLSVGTAYAVRRADGVGGVRLRGCLIPAALVLVQLVIVVRPLRMQPEHRCCREVASWLSEGDRAGRPLFVTHPWIVYELGLVEHPRAHKGRRLLASMPIRTLVAWDSKYTESDFHGLHISDLGNGAYRTIRLFPGSPSSRGMVVGVAEKVISTPIPAEDESTYPIDLIAVRNPIVGIYYTREK